MEATDNQDGLLFIKVHLKSKNQERFGIKDTVPPASLTHSSEKKHMAWRVPLSTFSPVMAKGALNHCSNVLQLLKMVGRRKFSNAQSSGSLFCNGVPVSRTRRGAR